MNLEDLPTSTPDYENLFCQTSKNLGIFSRRFTVFHTFHIEFENPR